MRRFVARANRKCVSGPGSAGVPVRIGIDFLFGWNFFGPTAGGTPASCHRYRSISYTSTIPTPGRAGWSRSGSGSRNSNGFTTTV